MTPQLNTVVQVTCAHLQQLVYPLWDKYTPKIVEWDQKVGLSKSLQPAWEATTAKWSALDDAYSLSNHFQTASQFVKETTSTSVRIMRHVYGMASSYYFYNLHPSVCYYLGKYKLTLEYIGDNVLSGVRRHGCYAAKKFQLTLKYAFYRYILPLTHRTVEVIVHNQYVDTACEALHLNWVFSEIYRLFTKLKAKSVVINAAVQKKTEFLMNEYGAAEKFNLFKKSIKQTTKKNILLILDITQEFAGFNKQLEPAVIDGEYDSSDYSDEEDITITLTRTLTETLSSTMSFETSKASSSISGDDVYSNNVQQFNRTQTEHTLDVNVTGDDVSSLESGSQAQVNYELGLWEDQIDSTLDLVEKSLESDFSPYLEKKLAILKELFSANFTALQSDNYKRYKVMNELIAEIDKDSEFIRTHEMIIEEPKVDRQIMRDKIQEARDVVESQMDHADAALSKAHSDVLTAYFEIAQITVDVLESFAETTILDFSLRLKSLIEYVKSNPDYDDKISWEAWKRFHKIKESIFQIRDQIFDEAHAYKDDPQTAFKPKALAKWDEYLRNINFHIGFIVRDNDEYLRLVRAQANVAYQQREGLTYELEQKIEADKRAAEESLLKEKLEREAREASELQEEFSSEKDEFKQSLQQSFGMEKTLSTTSQFAETKTEILVEMSSNSAQQIETVREHVNEVSSISKKSSASFLTAETSSISTSFESISDSSPSSSASTPSSSETVSEKTFTTLLEWSSGIDKGVNLDGLQVSEPCEADEDFVDENIEAL